MATTQLEHVYFIQPVLMPDGGGELKEYARDKQYEIQLDEPSGRVSLRSRSVSPDRGHVERVPGFNVRCYEEKKPAPAVAFAADKPPTEKRA